MFLRRKMVEHAATCLDDLVNAATDKVARASLQVHGAIGYTWEADLHLFHKRALVLQRAWGDAEWHRNRIADARDLPGATHA